MERIIHPVWGDNRANLIGIDKVLVDGEWVQVQKRILGFSYTGSEYIESYRRDATDDDRVGRTFRHMCGLVHIFVASHRPRRGAAYTLFTLLLDGHLAAELPAERFAVRFASHPDELAKNNGEPIAEVTYSGIGTRTGTLSNYGVNRVMVTFRDKAQMFQYMTYGRAKPMPETVEHDGVEYRMASDGSYQSSDGSMLPLMFLAGAVAVNLLSDAGVDVPDGDATNGFGADGIDDGGNTDDFDAGDTGSGDMGGGSGGSDL